MSKKYTSNDSPSSQKVGEPAAVAARKTPLHLDITLEDNAMVADIKKALKLIKGIASVKVARTKSRQSITPALANKIQKARQELAEGKYTECKSPEELTAYLNSL